MISFILLDTNVILDFAMKRGEHYAPAMKIMYEIAEGHLIAYLSASQITDIYYFLEKKFSHDSAVRVIADLIGSVRVIGIDRETIESAIESGMPDFEDAVQTAAAQDAGIDIVVTRDKMGFINSGLQVYSPEEFLETLT
jgi:predicted nucleic acid-binding protein